MAAGKVPAKAPRPAVKTAKQIKLHDMIMASIDQDKGLDIVSIDLAGKTAIADYMIVASGTSSRHVVSMGKKIRERIAKEGFKAHIEGADTGDWVIVDALDVIVHLFRPEVRNFYNLEKLWSTDFSTVDYTLYKSS